MCTLYTYTNLCMPRFSPSGFFGPRRDRVATQVGLCQSGGVAVAMPHRSVLTRGALGRATRMPWVLFGKIPRACFSSSLHSVSRFPGACLSHGPFLARCGVFGVFSLSSPWSGHPVYGLMFGSTLFLICGIAHLNFYAISHQYLEWGIVFGVS